MTPQQWQNAWWYTIVTLASIVVFFGIIGLVVYFF